MSQFQKVNSDSQLSGVIRSCPEDFQVDEIPVFEASGKGEHVLLHIKKTGENTDWVGGQLAKIAGVPRRDVSYAGLKDRNAVTTQWFSVQMPGKEAPDWKKELPDSIVVLDENRHERKLKRGTLKGNQFKLVIRDFKGDEAELASSVERIIKQGVPNYFGEQRFGNGGFNVKKAEQWFNGEFKIKDRQKRSIYLSAARSWIFNHVLSARVKDGTWNQALPGDMFMLNGSKSCFLEQVDELITKRIDEHDIHPTGVLWGRGRVLSQEGVAELETNIASEFQTLCDGLEKNGLKQERRALRLPVEDLDYTYKSSDADSDTIRLSFSLPPGAYATTVLSEIGLFS